MTENEMIILADEVCQLPAAQMGEFASILFDRVEINYSAVLVDVIYNQLMEAGVDVRPLCKKKHPT